MGNKWNFGVRGRGVASTPRPGAVSHERLVAAVDSAREWVWSVDRDVEVQQAGRMCERDCFRDCRATSARAHAMQSAGLSDDVVSPEEEEDFGYEAARTIASGDTAKLQQLGVDLEFPEVATSGLALSSWVPRFWEAWQHSQNIEVLDARALVMSLRRIALSSHGRDVRQVLDNLGVCLCFDRYRSRRFELLNQRRVSPVMSLQEI